LVSEYAQTERAGGWRPKHPVIDGLVIIGIAACIVGGKNGR
jgi:hypothetical protein